MLKSNGKDNEAKKWAKRFSSLSKRSGESSLIVQAADLHWDFGDFFEAAELYGRIVDAPSNDYVTRRYLACLVESDQREKARQIIASLNESARATSAIRRIEANLARQSGDWDRLHDLLKAELEITPGESAVAIGYLGALRIRQKTDVITSYIATNPVFDKTNPENEFEFAKYQSQYGFIFDALMRLYRIFRQHPNDPEVAGYFLSTLLLGEDINEKLVVDVVTPGTAVLLNRAGDSRWIALELDGLPTSTSWPEVIPVGSPQGRSVTGKKVGDKVVFNIGMNKIEYEVSGLEHIFLFASKKAHELIATNAMPAGPLWSVRVIKDSGEPDIELILESLKSRSQYVENVFNGYRERRIPISYLAGILGTDPLTLLLEWPCKHTMFVSRGTAEERENEREVLRKGSSRCVLDLLALVELVRWGVFDEACTILGKPLVPQAL